MQHTAKYEISLYADSDIAYAITFRCSCGLRGTLKDSVAGPTMKRARLAFRRHFEAAKLTREDAPE